MPACKPAAPAGTSGPIPQRGFLWQRAWTALVQDAFVLAASRMESVTLLGGEIVWEGDTPHLLKSSIPWPIVAHSGRPCALALRVAPYRGSFESNDANAHFIVETATSFLAEAAESGARVLEFQLDYDCPQKKLAGYRKWVAAMRSAIRPMPLSITALPSWLDEPAFAKLAAEVDGYVLQVHSVPARGVNGRETICDPRLAKAAVEKAARLGHPFSVALPTYRCLGGYDAEGKLLAVAMDGVQPSWPRGTRVLEFAADAEELARLVRDWQIARPALLHSIVWYRVPTDADTRNWRWPTLKAVGEGRAPAHKLTIGREGENPIDLLLVNEGEAEEQFAGSVTAGWAEENLVAADALADWAVKVEGKRAIFSTEPSARLRLLPGERRAIGWLRHDRPTTPTLELLEATRITR